MYSTYLPFWIARGWVRVNGAPAVMGQPLAADIAHRFVDQYGDLHALLLLGLAGVKHEVLNAKQHAREAAIVAEAGRPGVVTIATNMAGRGTDIVLGGNVEKQASFIEADLSIPEDEKATRIQKLHDEWQTLHDHVKAAGGLHIIGTERHESRRIDNQLRGRAGRQGDPGSSRFYLSLDDPLLRIFAGDRVRAIMDRLKMPEGEAKLRRNDFSNPAKFAFGRVAVTALIFSPGNKIGTRDSPSMVLRLAW